MSVLIIEDNRTVAENIRRCLEVERCGATVAPDGEEGARRALLNEYDCIILDLNLPRMVAVAAGVTVTCEAARSVTLQGDEALITQLVGNLLRNAIKFNRQGGSVRLVLERTGLNVIDTGVGLSPAQVARVFQRFYQTDASRAERGFGLGLPIARRIAELHGWSLRITSDLGVGTTAEIGF